ncbi:MAG TPA: hypothetical protein VGF67_15295 [Ktedonobacteraceae bacterium]|jgi:hypothetical protein
MEQRQVLPKMEALFRMKPGTLSRKRLLSVFFAVDKSPDNRPVVDLQRQACWIGLALVLQAINEVVALIPILWMKEHLPLLAPWLGTLAFGLILGSFFMMWMAFRATTLRQQTRRLARHPYAWQSFVLVLVLLTSLAGIGELSRAVVLGFFAAPQYTNDGTSLDTNAAMLLLQGRDPYTSSDIVHIARAFSLEPDWTTPLRVGQFANRLNYPSPVELRTVLDTDMKAGQAPEFEARVSYPALSFLTLVPFIWLGFYNVLPFYLFCYLALVAMGWSAARKELRPWIVVFALANISMWSSVVGGNVDVLTIVFIVMAWLWRQHRWRSALALGLALACKQPAWFFLLFYAVLMVRTYGWHEALRRVAIAVGMMMALNLPFILWNPQVWLAGVTAPIADPMFPMGVGLVGLVGSPFMHTYLSGTFYAVLEYALFYPLCLLWYWGLCRSHPEAAMLLAVLPLFFAWRSLPSYFACAAFPMFLLLVARGNPGQGGQARLGPVISGPAHGRAVVQQRQAQEALALA